jgi:hypothetical protein
MNWLLGYLCLSVLSLFHVNCDYRYYRDENLVSLGCFHYDLSGRNVMVLYETVIDISYMVSARSCGRGKRLQTLNSTCRWISKMYLWRLALEEQLT